VRPVGGQDECDLVGVVDCLEEALAALAPVERAVIHSLLLRVLAELNPDALPAPALRGTA
jgi:hypothetical protein